MNDIRFTEDTISVDLVDGRSIAVPLVWYPRLLNAQSSEAHLLQKRERGDS